MIIYGSEIAQKIKQELKLKVAQLKEENKRLPKLVVVLVGNDPASLSYVKGKDKACQEIDFLSEMRVFDENISEQELIIKIHELNDDATVDGILVQMPLPKHIDAIKVIENISPNKDVDGLHPINVGKLHLGIPCFQPCTPKGIIYLLEEMGCEFAGKNAVVLGRSKLVGAPVAKLLENKNCTVTVCHSQTINLKEYCRNADILIVAVGKAQYINADYVKEGAYVIDVGINRVDGKIVGDVDFASVCEKAQAITPVPKGVGPMTIAMLLANTYDAYLQNKGE